MLLKERDKNFVDKSILYSCLSPRKSFMACDSNQKAKLESKLKKETYHSLKLDDISNKCEGNCALFN